MRRSLLAVLFTVSAVGLLFAQMPPAAAPAAGSEYYPAKKNSRWTYKLNDVDVVVQAGDTKDGETKIETLAQGKVVASETIKVDATGIHRTRINATEIKPPVKILELKDGKPAAKGSKWPVKSTLGTQEISGEFEVKDDNATLKVPAGEFTKVVQVEGAKLTVAGTETAVKYWIAPGKGIVKLSYTINGQEAVLELKSFEEGK